MTSPLRRAAAALEEAHSVLVVTGAGISAESGIPTFRGAGGLWEGVRAEELATPAAFARDPERVWRWYRWRNVAYGACEPNVGHEIIARLEPRYDDFLLLTQNVDGLHRRAGSGAIVELHGTIAQKRCTACAALSAFPEGAAADGGSAVPRCERCGAATRPHILWFGETYWPGVLERAGAMAERADVTLVVGTSAQVWPPAAIALGSQRAGAFLIDVNPESTIVSEAADVHLVGGAGEVLSALWEEMA